MRFKLAVDHCNGQSVSHPCRNGVFTDPTEDVDGEIVDATDSVAAEGIGWEMLSSLAAGMSECDCKYKMWAGSNDWWDSVSIVATEVDYSF